MAAFVGTAVPGRAAGRAPSCTSRRRVRRHHLAARARARRAAHTLRQVQHGIFAQHDAAAAHPGRPGSAHRVRRPAGLVEKERTLRLAGVARRLASRPTFNTKDIRITSKNIFSSCDAHSNARLRLCCYCLLHACELHAACVRTACAEHPRVLLPLSACACRSAARDDRGDAQQDLQGVARSTRTRRPTCRACTRSSSRRTARSATRRRCRAASPHAVGHAPSRTRPARPSTATGRRSTRAPRRSDVCMRPCVPRTRVPIPQSPQSTTKSTLGVRSEVLVKASPQKIAPAGAQPNRHQPTQGLPEEGV